ncbi:MAG: hypothetical protein WAQ98_12730 [Blastocatellia bacterium]
MADINITVQNDVFTITLDTFEWQQLIVDGIKIPPYTGPNRKNIQFQGSGNGVVKFTAIANQNIKILNPSAQLFMLNSANTETYMCIISYESLLGQPGQPDQIILKGSLAEIPTVIPGAQQSPLSFSQGRMTGHFQLGSPPQ